MLCLLTICLLSLYNENQYHTQVPITTFWEPKVIGWGCAFYVCVLAKLPLGLYMPHFQMERIQSTMPFDLWRRDALVTGLAMTCRGEFSFIIAAFSLGAGVFDVTTYSSVIWAILLSCITSPLALLFTIFHYNKKSRACLDSIKTAIGKVPLHLVIQCRSNLKWGLQTHLSQCATNLGLTIIDQRSWHPRGMDAVVVSELFVQDSKTEILVRKDNSALLDDDEEGGSETQNIKNRCEVIRAEMLRTIDQTTAEVKVIRWMPHVLYEGDLAGLEEKLESEARLELDKAEVIDTLLDAQPKVSPGRSGKKKTLSGPIESLGGVRVHDTGSDDESSIFMTPIEEESVPVMDVRRRRNRCRTLSVPAFATSGLWEEDEATQLATMQSAFIPTVTYDLSTPSYGQAARRRQVSEMSQLMEGSMLPTVEEHLEGFVRHDMEEENVDE